MKFSIGLVFFSGKEDLKDSLSSLLMQNFSDFEILFRDHSSSCEGITYIKKQYPELIAENKIKIFSGENLYHSGGHNFLISEMLGENYICASIDMKYEKTMLENFHNQLQKKQDFDCFTGKLLNKENRIDSAGIEKTWYFRFYDRGQGKPSSLYSVSEQIFGATGALFCLRRKLITELSLGIYQNGREQVFNEKLHYKNDVELMCRIFILQRKTWYDSEVYAIHNRNISSVSQKSKFAILSSIKGQKFLLQHYAFCSSPLLKCWQIPFAWVAYFFSWIRRFL